MNFQMNLHRFLCSIIGFPWVFQKIIRNPSLNCRASENFFLDNHYSLWSFDHESYNHSEINTFRKIKSQVHANMRETKKWTDFISFSDAKIEINLLRTKGWCQYCPGYRRHLRGFIEHFQIIISFGIFLVKTATLKTCAISSASIWYRRSEWHKR